jgi:hypothetical protein
MDQDCHFDRHQSLNCSNSNSNSNSKSMNINNIDTPTIVVGHADCDPKLMVSDLDDTTAATSSANTSVSSSANDGVADVATTTSSTTAATSTIDTNNNISSNNVVRGGRKRVRLVPHHEVVALVEEMNETERDNTWWRQEDFDDTKAHVKHMCRELRQERRFSDSLTDAYERAWKMNLVVDGGGGGGGGEEEVEDYCGVLNNNPSSSTQVVAIDSIATSATSCASFAAVAPPPSSNRADDVEKCLNKNPVASQKEDGNNAAVYDAASTSDGRAEGEYSQKSIEDLRNDPVSPVCALQISDRGQKISHESERKDVKEKDSLRLISPCLVPIPFYFRSRTIILWTFPSRMSSLRCHE